MRVYSLRAARIYLGIIAAISLSLFVSLIHSRPAHAEDFLRKTVRCVVDVLALEDCRNTSAPAGGVTSTPAPAANQSAPTAMNSGTGAAPQQSIAKLAQSSPLVVPMEPLTVELSETHELPMRTQNVYSGEAVLGDFMPHTLAYGVGEGFADNSEPVEATREGWKILGILWYWWAAGIAAVAGVGVLVKRYLV